MSTEMEADRLRFEPWGTMLGTPRTVMSLIGFIWSTVTLKCSVRLLTWFIAVT